MNLALDVPKMQKATIAMDGFCQCSHDVPPMLANLRGAQELIQKCNGELDKLSSLEFGHLIDVFWSTTQTPALIEKLLECVSIDASTQRQDFELPYDVLVKLVVRHHFRVGISADNSPQNPTRIDRNSLDNLDYLKDVNLNFLEYVERWIEADQVGVSEILVFFTVMRFKYHDLSVPVMEMLLEEQREQQSSPLLDQIREFGYGLGLKHSEQPYTPKQPKQNVLVFESSAIN